MKKTAILGSTGSIGTQTLDIIKRNMEDFQVTALTCGSRIDLFEKQIEIFKPGLAVTASEENARILSGKFPEIDVMWGSEGLFAAATCDCDIVVNSLAGILGLEPTYEAVKAGNNVAFANKETLVAGGALIMDAADRAGVKILPVDSEHSAIFQCIRGSENSEIKRIILTASGGPFRGYTRRQLETVTLEQALKHPKWNMGKKITIDSATLMNKGLEVIEAKWLFDIAPERIQVVVHPQSIVHSGVEFYDTSVIAQMGLPDMRVPISYALYYPDRALNEFKSLDFFSTGRELTFEKPDMKTFKCIAFAYEALERGSCCPAALNGANEALVAEFLSGKIKYTDIQDTLERVLDNYDQKFDMSLEGILETDRKAREDAMVLLKKQLS